MAYECLLQIVLPILNIPETLKYESRHDANRFRIFYKLTGVVLLFMQRNVDEPMDKIISIIKETINAADMKMLLDLFRGNSLLFYSSRHVMQLFEYRRNYLTEKIILIDTNFTWSMPGSISRYHPEVTKFLRGNEQIMVYTGHFSGIQEARNFSDSFSGLKDGYSLYIIPSGHGRNAQVLIKKTKEYYKSIIDSCTEYKSELDEIEIILKNNNHQPTYKLIKLENH